jgi:hypothetical protein
VLTKADKESFCLALQIWADLMAARKVEIGDNGVFDRARREIELAIKKSCLLDRMINCGEQPSKTKCPVHQGIWTGCHLGWPGQQWSDGTPVRESRGLREWYDAGCRCFLHKCGCTTGWQPDEACGCVPAIVLGED